MTLLRRVELGDESALALKQTLLHQAERTSGRALVRVRPGSMAGLGLGLGLPLVRVRAGSRAGLRQADTEVHVMSNLCSRIGTRFRLGLGLGLGTGLGLGLGLHAMPGRFAWPGLG